jgi:osmotically-inducible protein OsmY
VPSDDERTERVVEALRSDATTSTLVDRLSVDTDGATVFVRGEVDDIDDEDNVIAVARLASGVADVVSELRIRALD